MATIHPTHRHGGGKINMFYFTPVCRPASSDKKLFAPPRPLARNPTTRNNPRMKYLFLLLGLLIPNQESQAAEACSPINHCQVEKKTYAKGKWKQDYLKELSFEKVCHGDRPTLALEEELGLDLELAAGTKSATNWQKDSYLTASLHTYKLTYVLASADVPADSKSVSFKIRPSPKSKSFLEVNCWQK